MKKKIDLIIHPGVGKCGSTFLQYNIFKNTSYFSLVKPFNERNKKFLDLKYKIFPPKYGTDILYPFNNNFEIEEFSEEIINKVENDKINKFILSDESILDKINYFSSHNLFSLQKIIKLISQNYHLNLKFFLSIRNHSDLFRSLYAYSYFWLKKKFKTFDTFIEEFCNNENLRNIYDFVSIYKEINNSFDCEILILPIEEFHNNRKNYLAKVENFLGEKIEINQISNTNENYVKNTENKSNYLRDHNNMMIKFLKILTKFHIYLKNYSFYEKNFNKIKFLKEIFKPKIKNIGIITLSKENENLIKKSFFKSNIEIQKITGLDLKKFNYF